MSIATCIYCGHQIPYGGSLSQRDAHQAMVEHDQTCPCNPLVARADSLELEARIQAQEARTQRATVQEIYQLITGATGEPGDWRGAEPVRQLIEDLAAVKQDAKDWHTAAMGLSADLTAIGQQRDALANFVNEVYDASGEGGDLDSAWTQERGVELRLLKAVAYDPEVHHDVDGTEIEPGETIYVRATWLAWLKAAGKGCNG